MNKMINVTGLDAEGTDTLMRLLESNPDKHYFSKDETYSIDGHEFKLSHSLLRRNKIVDGIPQAITKVDVLGKKPIGIGAFGFAFNIEGTLTFTQSTAIYTPDNNHVVKMTLDYKGEFTNDQTEHYRRSINPTSMSEIQLERKRMKIGNRVRPKKIQTEKSKRGPVETFLTMRKFKGNSLAHILKSGDLTSDQRFKLTIALLKALKEQVHDVGIVHRDIKPENIIVDLETMEVNIIDFGLSLSPKELKKIRATARVAPAGSPQYVAPEILDNKKPDEKADIYSLGRLLTQLWGDNDPRWSRLPGATIIENTKREQQINLEGLFNIPSEVTFEDLANHCKDDIRTIIRSMCARDKTHRATMTQLIDDFYLIYLSHHYPAQNHERIIAAFTLGSDLKNILPQQKDANEFNEALKQSLENLEDEPDIIKEFTHGLGWHALADVENKKSLLNTAEKIVADYRENIHKYIDLLEAAEIQLQNLLILKSNVTLQLKSFILELNDKINRIMNKPFDLDLLNNANRELDEKYESWSRKLEILTDEVKSTKRYQIIQSAAEQLEWKPDKQPVPPEEDIRFEQAAEPRPNEILQILDQLKNSLLLAIRRYIYETSSDKNIDKRKRAASESRISDITDFSQIINRAESKDQLLQNLQGRMKSMKVGFFGARGSSLNRKLNEAIKQHHKTHSHKRKK